MSQINMYPGRTNSPVTRLQHSLTSAATTLDVTTISVLPAPPNLATIGYGEDAETILYTGISGFDLTGITRGFQGTAKAWPSQTVIGRMFTEYDHATFKANIEDLVTSSTITNNNLESNSLTLQPQGENIVGFGYEPCGGVLRIDDNDPRIIYSLGDWTRMGVSPSLYSREGINATGTYSNNNGASLTLSFIGTGVVGYFWEFYDCGIISVSIDGGVPTEYDLYYTPVGTAYLSNRGHSLCFGLTFGYHTVTITTVGKNVLSTGYRSIVYFFDVIQTTTSSLTLALDGERDKSSALVDGNRITSLSDITSTIPEITQLIPNANFARISPTWGTVFSDNFERDDGAVGNGWNTGTISGHKLSVATGTAYNGSADWTDREIRFTYVAPSGTNEIAPRIKANAGHTIFVYASIQNATYTSALGIRLYSPAGNVLLSAVDCTITAGTTYYVVLRSHGNIYSASISSTGYTTNLTTVYAYSDALVSGDFGLGVATATVFDDVVVTAPVPYGWSTQSNASGSCHSYLGNTLKVIHDLNVATSSYPVTTFIPVSVGQSYTFKRKRKISSYTSGTGAHLAIVWAQSNGVTEISRVSSTAISTIDTDFVEVSISGTAPPDSVYAYLTAYVNGILTCEWKEPLFELTSTATGVFHLKEFRSDLISLDNTGSVVRTAGIEDEIGYRVEAEDGSISKFNRPKETIHHWDRVKTWTNGNGWIKYTSGTQSMGKCIYTSVLNDAFYIGFVGTGIDLLTQKGADGGILGVTVDSGTEFFIDDYAPSTSNITKTPLVYGLPYGYHQVKIRCSYTKNSLSSGYLTLVDAFDIYVPKIPTLPANNVKIGAVVKADPDHGWIRYEENEGVVYSGTWVPSSVVLAEQSVKALLRTNTLNSYVEFSFIGNAIRWIGTSTTNQGIAEVFTDEGAGYVSRGTIDLYVSNGINQAILYTKVNIPLKLNKIKLNCTYTKNVSATDYYINVDAFEVKNSLYVTDLRNQVLSKDDVDTLFRNHLEAVNPHLITASMLNAPTYTTSALTYYVDVTNGSDMNSGTATLPFQTITYALSLIPKNLKHAVIIRVCAGNYEAEGAITIQGFFGEGTLKLAAWNGSAEVSAYTDAVNYVVSSTINTNNISSVSITGLKGTADFSFAHLGPGVGLIRYCDTVSATDYGIVVGNGFCTVQNCRVSNKTAAGISTTTGGRIYSLTNAGATNNYALYAMNGGIIHKGNATQPAGTATDISSEGGRIFQQASPFKVMRFTRDISTATGNQVITGVGFKPALIEFEACISGTMSFCMGVTCDSESVKYTGSAEAFHNADGSAMIIIAGSGDQATASGITYDADGFTIPWIKTGSPTGTISITAKCYAT